jgi:hypothetical protein
MLRPTILLLGTLMVAGSACAQVATSSSPTQTSTATASASPAPLRRDAQAVTLVSQAYQAMTGLTPLQDATILGAAVWTAGSDEETGSATLEAKGSLESRMVLSLSQGLREELRNSPLVSSTALSSSLSSGAWAAQGGTWYAMALHNCWTDASWFFPAFTLQAALNDPAVSLIYAGPDTLDGASVIHLTLYRTPPRQTAAMAATIQRFSRMDLYLDSTSGLPLALMYDTHPDDNANLDIPVDIRYSNYQRVSGVQVPFHIQKFLQGSLLLDLKVGSVQINSGLTDAQFTLPVGVTPTTGGAQ